MSNEIWEELKNFLAKLKLSNYEIDAYITLLNSKTLTAREITRKSGVPRGRIYDILENLKIKGMIEVNDSRPKVYKPMFPNLALNNLISHIENQNQKNIINFYNEAKSIESKLKNRNSPIKLEHSEVFWSTAYGRHSIESLYIRSFSEVKEELILTGFLNKNTVKILSLTIKAHEGVKKALERGVKVYYLWSLEFIEEEFKKKMIDDLIQGFKNNFGLNPQIEGFELRFTQKKIPTYYDIFDIRNIIFKLQNPINPWQIFACMNVLDPNLAENLRKKFFDLWKFKSFENTNKLNKKD